jgi:uncharacterized protein (DUF924 family)
MVRCSNRSYGLTRSPPSCITRSAFALQKKQRVHHIPTARKRAHDGNHMTTTTSTTPAQRAQAILDFWFGAMNDATLLNREAEPFSTYFQRWYGKSAEVDASIRDTFEPVLVDVTASGRHWDDTMREWRAHPHGMLALTILLDQMTRNMYRNSARMYAQDALALLSSEAARAEITDDMPLVHRMFISMPLMHVENLTLQERMLRDFEALAARATTHSPHNVGFFEFALGYAKRHVDMVRTFGRFPHRNELLGRISTAAEVEALKHPENSF